VRRGARIAFAAAALALGVAACEPEGPGALSATVYAPVPTGAVLLEVVGTGITGFEGAGDVRAYAAESLRVDTLQRVIVMSPTGGAQLHLRVKVEDVSAEPPRATVVDAVDPTNRKITSLVGYTVRISR
jgi:hypothetical protein